MTTDRSQSKAGRKARVFFPITIQSIPTFSRCVLATSLLFAVSCGETVVGVSGIVTADGKQVDSGAITLQRADGSAPAEGATVEDGRFDMALRGGFAAGEYLVTLEGFQKTGRTIDDVQRGPIPETVVLNFAETSKKVEISADNAQDLKIDFHTESRD